MTGFVKTSRPYRPIKNWHVILSHLKLQTSKMYIHVSQLVILTETVSYYSPILRYNILVCEAIQQHLLKHYDPSLAVSALSLQIHAPLVWWRYSSIKAVLLHKGVYFSFCLPLLSCHCYCLVFTCRLTGSMHQLDGFRGT